MTLVCLDLEGVLLPEIWIAFAESVGIPEFRRTTRDEPDYDKLMRFRIDLLGRHKFRLSDIQRAAGNIEPLPGAVEFCAKLRELTQLVILSDTFEQFARPVMAKLNYPTLFCNSLITSEDGAVTGYRLRQTDGKKHAVIAFKSMNLNVFAAGDSFNDLNMISEADEGCLFRAPERIRRDYPGIPRADSLDELLGRIEDFLRREQEITAFSGSA
ncbi:MAG: bifunctional phosphoserine phosphatase/homoserine phosphotransferase ThrH [Treponema sp.]|jgi:phosphoserine/homoserine phosphotransferase|nr:bifunctional phosphoserine phosphatase/homoserine phosphotransferase ThrH [Treponema sp.]